VVDYVVSASRFKLLVPKDGLKLTLVLTGAMRAYVNVNRPSVAVQTLTCAVCGCVCSGVRTPRVGRTPEEPSEPYGAEAAQAMTRLLLQRDVTVEVDGVDKSGAFTGALYTDAGDNAAVLLLEQGLATLHAPSADQSRAANQLYAAETRAKAALRNIWINYNEEQERARREAEATAAAAAVAERAEAPTEKLALMPVDVVAGNRFFAQVIGDGVRQLETLMAEFARFHATGAPALAGAFAPKKGELVSAQFSQDGEWCVGAARAPRIHAHA
jgi:staphylococcal nuclease domain-containing protein 1